MLLHVSFCFNFLLYIYNVKLDGLYNLYYNRGQCVASVVFYIRSQYLYLFAVFIYIIFHYRRNAVAAENIQVLADCPAKPPFMVLPGYIWSRIL